MRATNAGWGPSTDTPFSQTHAGFRSSPLRNPPAHNMPHPGLPCNPATGDRTPSRPPSENNTYIYIYMYINVYLYIYIYYPRRSEVECPSKLRTSTWRSPCAGLRWSLRRVSARAGPGRRQKEGRRREGDVAACVRRMLRGFWS